MSARRAVTSVVTDAGSTVGSVTTNVDRLPRNNTTAKAGVKLVRKLSLSDFDDEDTLEPQDELEIEDDGKVLSREDRNLDRRIIEGMLHDRDGLFAEMAKQGVSKGAVLRRAAELGLSEALIRQLRGVAADLAGDRQAGRRPIPSSLGARTCLSCDRIFLSSGPGNRLCMRCRGGDAGLAQL